MKITFGMIVCNGDDYIEECIKQVYQHADRIVIAEGATRNWMTAMKWTTPESKDRTNKIIETLQENDTERKLRVVHGGWPNKIQQSNAYMELVDSDTDYIWQLDSDELYKHSDIERTIEFLEREKPTYVTIKQLHFFKNFRTIAVGQTTGWGWETPQPRIQRFYPGCRYIEHRPPMIIDPVTGKNNKDINYKNLTEETGVFCFHYNYVTEKQVREKIAYYAIEFPQAPRLKTWINDVWESWDRNREFVEYNYGTHPTAWRGSVTRPYNDDHPEEMEKRLHETILDNP